MRPLVLRNEEPPDDTVVVVRGGEMRSDFVRRTADRAHRETGMFLVSVFGVIDVDLDTLCRTEPDLVRYGMIRTSTCGQLRLAGFALIATLHRPHFDLVLPDLDDGTLDRLEDAFDAPRRNPARAEGS